MKMPWFTNEVELPLKALIDADGSVVRVDPIKPTDSLFAVYAALYLKSVPFSPGRMDGTRVETWIRLEASFRPRFRIPELRFPVDSLQRIVDYNLYFRSVEMNGIVLPTVNSFPEYFCDLHWSDTATNFPFVLVSVQLDTVGTPIAVEHVHTTYPAFADQIRSAARYAQYSPALVNGKAVSSQCFLLVSFFSGLSYPRPARDLADDSADSWFSQLSIRLLADTVGIMSVPLPRFDPPDVFLLNGKHQGYLDTVACFVTVDTLGRASLGRMSKAVPEVQSAVRNIIGRLKYFPAVDYSGFPHRFTGLVSLEFNSSAIIRIDHSWLR